MELEIEFKANLKQIFINSSPCFFAIQDDLVRAYDAGIARGIWTPIQFYDWRILWILIRKPPFPKDDKPRLTVCGNLLFCDGKPEMGCTRHSLPLPVELIRKPGRGCCITKIDLADAYIQVRLGPESYKRLALSTHRSALLQNVLPFGILSAPGYFQKIMDDFTSDLPAFAKFLLPRYATKAEPLYCLTQKDVGRT